MFLHLLQGQALRRILMEKRPNEVSGVISNENVGIWELVVDLADLLVGGFNIGCFKRRVSNQKSIDDNTEGPDVHLGNCGRRGSEYFVRVRTVLLVRQNLWGDVVGCTT